MSEALTREEVRNRYLSFEKEGRYDEHVDSIDLSKCIPVTPKYHYFPVGLKEKAVHAFRYECLVKPFMARKNHKDLETEVVGKENLRGIRSAIVVSNHVHMFDCVALKKAVSPHYLHIVAAPFNNFSGSLGDMMRASGMMPLPSGYEGMPSFEKAIGTALKKKRYVLFYPERAEWWYYHKLRPFKDGAFHYAVKYLVPIVPCFITFSSRKKPYSGKDGDYPERMTVHILRPIMPDPSLPFAKERERMKREAWEECRDCYERSYGKSLPPELVASFLSCQEGKGNL